LDELYESGKKSADEYVKRLRYAENLDFTTAENNMKLLFVKPVNIAGGLDAKVEKEFEPFMLPAGGGRLPVRVRIVTFTDSHKQSSTAAVLYDIEHDTQYVLADIRGAGPMLMGGSIDPIENMKLEYSPTLLKYKNDYVMSLKIKFNSLYANTPSQAGRGYAL
jgi:hypothetical protein